MSLMQLLLTNLAVVLSLMTLLWFISLIVHDASIIDLVWGLGFVVIAWLSFCLTDAASLKKFLLVILTTLWGVRLLLHLAIRNLGKSEDYRYREMRAKHGKKFWIVSLFSVFWLQAGVMWVVSLPLQTGQLDGNSGQFHGLLWIGTVVWLVGFLFEAVGDYQLSCFKKMNLEQGAVMDHGLWRYTRHPNYFGDFLVWWGFYLISLGNGKFWWSGIGPLVMSIFLMRVSGVTLLEKNLKQTKPGYREYILRTSSFFPWPPRSKKI